jgi:ubiquinone/menaquinone biosynthesis C-methylase UbiE
MRGPVERFSRSAWMPPWTRHEHVERYHWAVKWAAGRVVVDAACGSGFGAGILLAGGAARVEGYDLAPGAIAEARELHARPDAHFAVADVTQLPCPDHCCDLFVSFETIEHVVDDRAFLRDVKRVLKLQGTSLCTTPNRTVTNPGITLTGKPYNPFHVREYSRADLEALLSEFFSHVSLWGQSFYHSGYIRALNRLGQSWPALAVRIHQLRKLLGIPWEKPEKQRPRAMPTNGEPEALAAVCTSAPLEA